ncbi:radical SAM family heme chaperone HemW [Buchnera aphidicola]|uniref:Heme chaperone HemW n=1 Tax=Buchnera aphidicola (Sarucallis kahawaluokalani) TaxID=1241878 RepID=A0A4D6YDK9_9GAMM|nr:radical SAM family heme chaperone HemW [Buchnera aphidicola]QCI26153.1 radical SAM family heme chaperone HemW [Buchnera aphidicola (Sarucallis kahawaluokalani)]
MFIPPLSLYIHIPWCIKKCPYCDFNSYKLLQSDSQEKYIKHLIQDLKNDIQVIHNRKINTIFIGGGTPSVIHNDLMKYFLKKIKKILSITKKIEITIEVNPENITLEKILDYITCGINRISFGVQSFNTKILQSIGRTHSVQKTINMLQEIKKYTNINFNIDLMYGLPEQTLQHCLSDLEAAISINPNHISWYQLSIEKNTVFYYQTPNLPKENKIWKMYHQGNKLLITSGYLRYEISSYTKKKNFCLHNLNYWKFGDYIGIGCGAHGKLTQKNGDIIRITKKKKIYQYYNNQKKYVEKIHKIQDIDKPTEYFMNVFRLFQPIKKKNFKLYTNLNLKYISKNIQKAISKKYIFQSKKYWYVSQKGKNFLNNLIMLFM